MVVTETAAWATFGPTIALTTEVSTVTAVNSASRLERQFKTLTSFMKEPGSLPSTTHFRNLFGYVNKKPS